MQHQVASWTQCRDRPRLFSSAGTDCFAQREHGPGQIEVNRLLGQHIKALQHVRGCCMPSRVGQIVIKHGWLILCRRSHPSGG